MSASPKSLGVSAGPWLLLLLVTLQAGLWPGRQPAAPQPPLPLLVLAGQSNMVGWTTNVDDLKPAERFPQTQVLFYGPDELGSTWGWLTPPTVSNNRFGPEISLGNTLVRHGVYPLVAQVKYAVGNTSLAVDWDPGTAGSRYAKLLQREAAAMASLQTAYPDREVFVAGFFWMQGESDAEDPAMAAAYGPHLAGLIDRLRADLASPQLPVFVGRIRDGYFPYAAVVRQAQADVAASVPNVRLVDTDALPLALDAVHYTSRGTISLGVAFANQYQDWLYHRFQLFLPVTAAP